MNHRIFAALFLASPLLILTSVPFPYTVPRWIFISILCTFWSILLVIDHLKNKTNTQFSYIDWALIIFVAALGITTLTSTDSAHSMWGSLERSFGYSLWVLLLIAYFGIKQAIKKPADKQFLLRFFTVILSLAALWGIAQKFIPGFSHTFSGARIGGTLGNALFYGAYLVLSSGLIALNCAQEKKYSRWWFFSVTTITLSIISLILTQTRGPILSLCLGISLALATYLYKTSTHKKYVAIGATALTALLIVGGIIAYNNKIITRTTISTRFFNWSMAWSGFKEKPLLGWGPENFNHAADKYFLPKLSEYSIAETHADKPHNYFLELAVTSGLLGLLSYIVMLLVAIYELNISPISSVQSSLLTGLLGASILLNSTSFETHGSIIAFIFIIAIISSLSNKSLTPKAQLPIFSILAIASIGILLRTTVPLMKDSTTLLTTLELTTDYSKERDAITSLQQKIGSTPFPHDYFTTISFAIVGQYWQNPQGFAKLTLQEQVLHADDMEWLRKTIDSLDATYPYDGVWKLSLGNSAYQLYSLTKQSADGLRVEKIFSDYAKISPTRQEPLMQLGQLALLQNNPEKSLSYFDSAIRLDTDFLTPYTQRSLALFALKKTELAWTDVRFLMSKNYEFASPQIANYIYNQLLENSMTSEALEFKTYFER